MSVPPLPPNEGVVEVWMPALAPLDDDEDDLYMTPPPETVHNENANNSEDEDDLYMTPPPENLNGHVENQEAIEEAAHVDVTMIRTPPRTPEHEIQTVQEQEHAERLQMTSPTLQRKRSALRGSIRQPIFEDLSRPSHSATSNPAQPPIFLAPPIQLY
ncbi:hypothetical protein HETIRDRAFT_416577 [Heterobasidion irregulare TC 32-1]|uniref:Uncharacterized protein n=1 Tax=Heterobasidion irregulare (strain TC 32-1) TaxID=747525 RepID=W4K9B6_HETIT|nr:uncharacterized protein HETIRDRAFT_416577 [Heterobasidion irregulare TC 32-1]ETW82373.1 hypothetical protein HETIRDRAFT_416577 [Heterobasidion irregulare TC 32-1]